MCQNAKKIINEIENSQKMKIVEIPIFRKEIKLPKIFILEIKNSQNIKKRILKLSNFRIPENP